MKCYPILLILATATLLGCSDNTRKIQLTTKELAPELRLLSYQMTTGDETATTTVHEIHRGPVSNSRILAIIYADSTGRLVSLAGTPVTTDRLTHYAGVFQRGWEGPMKASSLQLFIDERGDSWFEQVDRHIDRTNSELPYKLAERYVVKRQPIPIPALVQLDFSDHSSVTISTELGAPVRTIIDAVTDFSAKSKDVRVALLPWDWQNAAIIAPAPDFD